MKGERVKLITFVSTDSFLVEFRYFRDIFHSMEGGGKIRAEERQRCGQCGRLSFGRRAAEASRTRKRWAELWTAAVAHTISLRLRLRKILSSLVAEANCGTPRAEARYRVFVTCARFSFLPWHRNNRLYLSTYIFTLLAWDLGNLENTNIGS